MFPRKKFEQHWHGMVQPIRIIGGVYFVGTYPASTHLINTGDGLILIDPGYADSLHLVIHSIHKLGFDPMDIRYIVNTHWHGDHTAATAQLACMCGAKTLIGADDAEKAANYFRPDILLRDGDTLKLGNTVMHFMETPGHTKGTISFFLDAEEEGKTYRVGMFGGAGANTLVSGKFDYPEAREGYRASLHRLMEEKVDVMLGNHVWNNDTEVKGIHLAETGENLFIDSELWGKFLRHCEKRLDNLIEKEAQTNTKI